MNLCLNRPALADTLFHVNPTVKDGSEYVISDGCSAFKRMYLVSYVTDAKTCLRGSSQLRALHSLDCSDNVSVTVLRFFLNWREPGSSDS